MESNSKNDEKTELDRQLGPEYISFKNTGYAEEPYIEGSAAINMANRIFGHDGWSSKILSVTNMSIEEFPDDKVTVTAMAQCRITLADGAFREDIGVGMAERVKGIGRAKKNAYKSAVTDSIKRTLRQFGQALGACCNDKSYVKQIKKVKKIETPINVETLIRPTTKVKRMSTRSPKSAQTGKYQTDVDSIYRHMPPKLESICASPVLFEQRPKIKMSSIAEGPDSPQEGPQKHNKKDSPADKSLQPLEDFLSSE
ncbi:DNA repair and recombination protein RAD52 [Nematocida major]|uniref:DNA repair and recombination protein RAD52 n=1 Tax=Nematocida major TaxID=1912982 RepID=UPI0020076E56|nr:DNA repair and recombination protein RAD52 [Nematocida major]KAH9385792.1 DNA repair and recombination protein RAD52 [Nematocida major]